MTTKNLVILAGVAVVLGGAAYFAKSGAKPATPRLAGKRILPAVDMADVAKVTVGEKLTLEAAEDGWKITSLHGYPADRAKIAEHLLALADLKVGQVAHGRKLGEKTTVTLAAADGRTLASVDLGDKHMSKPSGQMAMYGGGGYPDGRYVAFSGETVLVKDALDAFDGDPKKWCDTRIASVPSSDVLAVSFTQGGETASFEKGTNGVWTLKGLTAKEELDTTKTYSLESGLSYLDFTGIADPKLDEAALGFATGCVCRVTHKDGSNRVERVARVGGTVPNGTDRYLKLDDGKWTFTIASYAAESLTKRRSDFVKAKEEPKKDDAKDAEKTADGVAKKPAK